MCLGIVWLSGCDAIMSIGQEEEEPKEDVASSEPSEPPVAGTPLETGEAEGNAPPVAGPSTPPPTPEEFLANFLAKPTNERTDDDLAQLTQTAELLAGLTELDVSGGAVSNLGLPHLALFPDLERLNLSSTRVTNDGLSQLTACRKLTAVTLNNLPQVDEVGIRELAPLPLEEISLVSTSVTEGVFVALAEFENLQVLHLDGNANLTGQQFRGLTEKFLHLRVFTASNTQIGYGLQRIGELKELEVFRVRESEVTDGVLEQLAQCRKLVELDVSHNPITFLGVPFLARLNELQILNLRDCNAINDEALNNLGRLQSLQRLDITGTQCTLSGAQNLKERLEDTVIVYDDQEI
jgi:Leucine-rich repeat (LRR) protein